MQTSTSTRAGRPAMLASSVLGLALFAGVANAQTPLRIAEWNITNYSSGRVADFQSAIYDVVPVGLTLAGQSMSPDVIIAQEVLSATAATNFRNLLNGRAGGPTDWAVATFVNGEDTDGAMFYRTSRVALVQDTTIISTGVVDTDGVPPHLPPRNTERWVVRVAGYDDLPATTIALYSAHMKSGSGVDESRRGTEAQRIAANVQALTPGWHAILGGDFNVDGYLDDGFQPLVGSVTNQPLVQNGPLYDPIRALGNWENNGTYQFIHTQDPGTGKQMDSRFDFLLISGNLKDGAGLDYIGNANSVWNLSTFADPVHSYRCWGNDGSSFNTSINITTNAMVGPTIAGALQRTADGQGHLPVFLDLRVPAKASVSATTIDLGDVPEGGTASASFTVSNAGDVAKWSAAGIAPLTYTITVPAGPFTVSQSGAVQTDQPGGGVNTHTISASTSVVGEQTRTITIATNAPEAPTLTVTLRVNVVSAACGPADVAGPGQTHTPDGELTADDIIVFISDFFAQAAGADVAGPGQTMGADGEFTADDIIVFIGLFFAGC